MAEVAVTPGVAALFDAVSRRARRSPSRTAVRRGGSSRTASCSAGVTGTSSVTTSSATRPRAFRIDRIDGEPEVGAARLVRATRRHRPGQVRPRRPAHLRRGPSRRSAGPRRRVARGLGRRAARRGGGRRAPRRRLGRGRARGRRTGRRSAPGCSTSSITPRCSGPTSCAPTSSPGSARSWTRARMSPRPLVGPRLRRVLALVPYVLAHPGVTIGELAERFEVSEGRARTRPRAPAALRAPPVHRRPAHRRVGRRRRGARSGSPSTSSGRCASHPPRASRCSPPVARCSRYRGPIRADRSRPRSTSSTTRSTRAAASRSTSEGATTSRSCRTRPRASEQVEIDYYSFARDEMTTRVVDPWRVFHAFGAWYLAAWCHRANGRAAVPRRPGARRARHRRALRAPELSGASRPTDGRCRRARLPPSPRRSARHAPAGAVAPTGWSRAIPTKPPSAAPTARWRGRARGQRAGLARTPPARARARRRRWRARQKRPRVAPDAAARILASLPMRRRPRSTRARVRLGRASERDDGAVEQRL